MIEARNAHFAETISRAGVVRLAVLALPQQAKYVGKRMADDRDLVLLSRGLPLKQTLTDALTERAFRECFVPAEASISRDAQSFADVVADIEAQLKLLLPLDFIESTPRPWLDYLPRYLNATARRIERIRPNVRRDAELAAKLKPFTTALRTLMAEPAISGIRPELDHLRWMIEEFRVSLFAQDLKTMLRVSEKRLSDQLTLAREAQR